MMKNDGYIQIKLPKTDKEMLEAKADELGLSLSSYCRIKLKELIKQEINS